VLFYIVSGWWKKEETTIRMEKGGKMRHNPANFSTCVILYCFRMVEKGGNHHPDGNREEK